MLNYLHECNFLILRQTKSYQRYSGSWIKMCLPNVVVEVAQLILSFSFFFFEGGGGGGGAA